ncbi:hypothetical protein [Burkholderia sp. BCC0322]|uniref:hypothetical protein n=1 Tax=unclassified Burkholderia TaxID=2613784 RepID=UPI00158B0636|nr:hypothetical protein [Burkholderia sp. BCC0322]
MWKVKFRSLERNNRINSIDVRGAGACPLNRFQSRRNSVDYFRSVSDRNDQQRYQSYYLTFATSATRRGHGYAASDLTGKDVDVV